jgi:hypothetical protein
MKAVSAIKQFMESDSHGRKVTMDELRELDTPERQELGGDVLRGAGRGVRAVREGGVSGDLGAPISPPPVPLGEGAAGSENGLAAPADLHKLRAHRACNTARVEADRSEGQAQAARQGDAAPVSLSPSRPANGATGDGIRSKP